MSTAEPLYKFEFLTGHYEYKPPTYCIVGGEVATRWWQRRREEWFILCVETGGRFGPFASRDRASDVLARAHANEALS